MDRDGNTYLGGSYGADAVFGEGQPNQVVLTERRSHGVASYDAAGALRWVRTTRDFGIESDGAVGIQHLTLDDYGNFFVSWIVFGNATWIAAGDTTFSDLEYYYLLITKHAPDGDLRWARLVESDKSLKVEYSATDHRGHVYVAGYSDGTFIELEGAILRNAHGSIHEHAFVAHYDETGSLVRLVHVAGDGNKYINAVGTSRDGDLYIAVHAGRNSPEIVIGNDTIRVAAESVMLVAKFGAVDTGSGSIAELPERVVITGSYPNPFRETATIYYELPAASRVRMSVYDLLGRELTVLVDRFEQAGRKEVVLDGSRWPGGVYLYRLEAGNEVATGRLVRRK